jgi:hypothetical protein
MTRPRLVLCARCCSSGTLSTERAGWTSVTLIDDDNKAPFALDLCPDCTLGLHEFLAETPPPKERAS